MAIDKPPSYVKPNLKSLEKCIPKNSKLKVSNGALVLKNDMTILDTIYLEAPFMVVPPFDLIKLIEVGKCCCYCGDTLKVYDKGRLKDKDVHDISDEKHARFMSGLDCADCSCKWCSQSCRKQDFSHSMLHHQPTNKAMTNQLTNSRGEKLILLYDRWVSFRKRILEQNLEWVYCGLYVALQLFHNPELKDGFMGLRQVSREDQMDFLGPDTDYFTLYEDLAGCFKNFKMPKEEFVQCVSIFKLNNYNSGIYLITSFLSDPAVEANCTISPFEMETAHSYEDFKIDVVDDHNVKLTKQKHMESYRKPIFTNSLKIDRKIVRVASGRNIPQNEPLNACEMHEPGSVCSSSDDSLMDKSAHVSQSTLEKPNKRTASFTSSGNSFGEGIIKYNRDQIREMLAEMTIESDDSDSETPIQLEVPEQFGKLRRKSVRFES